MEINESVIILLAMAFIGGLGLMFWRIHLQTKREGEKVWKKGFEAGREKEKEEMRINRVRVSREISFDEVKMVDEFLIKHKLVMCYDLSIGGFRLRRLIKFSWPNDSHVYLHELSKKPLTNPEPEKKDQ
jgi:hypothetical protein